MHLPVNIRLIRKRWRENSDEFGERFGLSRFAIGKYEKGKNEPSAFFLVKLCELTGISAMRLVHEVLQDDDVFERPLKPGENANILNESGESDYKRTEKDEPKGSDKLILEALLKLQETVDKQGERIVALENKVLKMERPF